MIVQSDFLTHWKTKALANRIGMEAALTALLALWTHCERRRAWEFQLTPLMLAGICDFKGEATELFDTMLAVNLIDRCADPAWFQVHEWGKVNAALVCKWVGHKGKGWFWHPRGYATDSIDRSIDATGELALEQPIVPTIGLDRIGEDRIGESDLAGKPPEGLKAASSMPQTSAAVPSPDLTPNVSPETTGSAKKKKGPAPRKPRAPNPLFDALVAIEGCDPAQITGPMAACIGKALKTIREVSPDVTAAEIQRRATAYRAKWEGITLTSQALAKHWGTLGGFVGGKKEGEAVQTFAPDGFERACQALYDDVTPWALLSDGHHAEIRTWLQLEKRKGGGE